jgi:hypothetical protein
VYCSEGVRWLYLVAGSFSFGLLHCLVSWSETGVFGQLSLENQPDLFNMGLCECCLRTFRIWPHGSL